MNLNNIIFIIILLILLFIMLIQKKKNFDKKKETFDDNKIPIYVSVTTIFQNQNILLNTLQSIASQTQLPDKVFIYLSEEKYLLDKGFTEKKITNKNLLHFLSNNKKLFHIKWVKNEGPYRKLLPLLKEKWNEDCIIITIDDDITYHNEFISNLVKDYNKHKCVINYRGFTPKINDISEFNYKKRHYNNYWCSWTEEMPCDPNNKYSKYIFNFSTNGAGTLFKPEFFHKTKELVFNKNIYLDICKTNDDIWFYITRFKNNIDCYIDNSKNNLFTMQNENLRHTDGNNKGGLWNTYNKNETEIFHKTLKEVNKFLYKYKTI